MATVTDQHSDPAEGADRAAHLSATDVLAIDERTKDAVRRFVAQLDAGGGNGSQPARTREEWEALWSAASGAASETEAIGRVAILAYRQRDARPDGPAPGAGAPTGSTPTPAPAGVAPVGVVSRPDGERTDRPGDGGTPAIAVDTAPVSPPIDFVPPLNGAPVPVVTVDRFGAFVPDAASDAVPVVAPLRPWLRPRWYVNHVPPQVRHLWKRTGVGTLDDRRRERWLSVATWVRNIGALLILFAAWQLWGTAIQQHHSQAALAQQFHAKVSSAPPKPGFTLAPASEQLTDPPDGTVMALLQIPAIGVSQYVVSGTDESDLALGPGHYHYTALPGQAGNVVIAGHRTTHGAPFNRLAELVPGDPMYLTTTTGQRLTYVVAMTPFAVSPEDVSVLNNFGDNRLTLTTCNPEYSAVQRLIVVAAYQPPGAAHAEPIDRGRGTPVHLLPVDEGSWNLVLLPWVIVLFAALVALGLLNRRLSRFYGRPGRWLILAPVWVALLLALFETLTNFLPSSV